MTTKPNPGDSAPIAHVRQDEQGDGTSTPLKAICKAWPAWRAALRKISARKNGPSWRDFGMI